MVGQNDQAFARLALNMLDTGMLSDTDTGTPGALVQTGFNRWLAGIVGETPRLNKVFGCLAGSVEEAASWQTGHEEISEEAAYLALSIDEPEQVIAIGPVIESLESILPGLGQTVFGIIEMASFKTINAFTPSVGLYYGSYLYWQGTDTDDDWRAEMEACYGEEWESEEDAEFYLPSQYRASFGCEWLFGRRQRVRERKLKRLARRHPLPWVRRLCSLALHMQALIEQGAMLPSAELIESECVYSSVLLRWHENDDLVRVFDDHVQRANECCDSYTDIASILEVPYEKEAFVRWEAATRKGFRLYELLDAALAVVVEQNQEIENDRSHSQER